MTSKTFAGNTVEIEESKAPARSFFEVILRERELPLPAKPGAKLLSPGAGLPGDPR
jgi:hypothetical protein